MLLVFLQQILAAVVDDELRGFRIRFETKFLSNVAEFQSSSVAVTRLANDYHVKSNTVLTICKGLQEQQVAHARQTYP